ncbi:MAG: D-2-hydroxyacid dehydrogenase [Caldilineaceae bacterium]|nr:D-2-hydroxyacid dehydrogenase [Caldilineaceae bacterium]
MRVLVYYPSMTESDLAQVQAAVPGADIVHAKSADEAAAAADGSEVIMGMMPQEVFARAGSLKWFQSASAGLDNVLFPELVESDVTLTNMAGLYAAAGGEQAWALLLALARGLPDAVRSHGARKWQKVPIAEITGRTMLILGMGGFGREIVKRGAGYDLNILSLDPVREEAPGVAEIRKPTRENLHAFLQAADVVMVACPLTQATYHWIGEEELGRMQSHAYLVNVSRGGIIDEEALAKALHGGLIAGAGLDVQEVEPLPQSSPLWEAPNFLMTAHQAGFSADRHRNVVRFFAENLQRYAMGKPLANVCDKAKGF